MPRYEDSSWATQPQAPMVRIRMPLPASCYVPPPSPWTWPGRGPAVPAPQVRGLAPLRSTTGPPSLSGPAALPIGPTTAGPTPVLPPPSSSQTLKSTSPPPALSRIFSGCHAPFYPDGAGVQCERCGSSAAATRRWEHSPRSYAGDGSKLES